MTLFLATDDDWRPFAPAAHSDAPTAALASPDLVLHRVFLNEAGARARIEEARMRATDLAAQPADELHVAVGPTLGDGSCWMAIIDRERMAAHLARMQGGGTDPAHIVPAALLLPEPGPAGACAARIDGLLLIRTSGYAAAVEPELGPIIAGDAMIAPLPETAPADLPLDLRQGAFAVVVRWWRLGWVRRTAAVLLPLFLLLVAAPPGIARWRQHQAERAADQRIVALARTALGRAPDDAAAGAARLAAERAKAEGSMVAPRLTLAASVLADAAPAHLEAVELLADGQLRLTLGGPAPAIQAAADRLARAKAFATISSGRDVMLGGRTMPSDTGPAAARLAAATRDAAILHVARSRPPAATVGAAVAAAGLDDALAAAPGGRYLLTVPAAPAAVLLPLIADLEAGGHRLLALDLEAGPDRMVSARMVVRP